MAYVLAAAAAVLAIAVRPALAPPGSRWLDAALLLYVVVVAASLVPLPPDLRFALSPSTRIIDLTLRLGDSASSSRRSALDRSGRRPGVARAGDGHAAAVPVRPHGLRARRRAPVRPRDCGAGPGAGRGRHGAARDRAAAAVLDVPDAIGDAVRAVHEPQRLRDLARDGAAAHGRLSDRPAAVAADARRPPGGPRRGVRQHGDVAHDRHRPHGGGPRRRAVAIGVDRGRRGARRALGAVGRADAAAGTRLAAGRLRRHRAHRGRLREHERDVGQGQRDDAGWDSADEAPSGARRCR